MTYSLFLIGRDGLMRQGVECLLTKEGFTVAGVSESVQAAEKTVPEALAANVVLWLDDDMAGLSAELERLKILFAAAHIVVIGSRLDAGSVMAAFSAGASGYISREVPCAGLVNAMRMIMAGEKVYPASVLARLSSANSVPFVSPANANARPLTSRSSKSRAANGCPLSDQELRVVHCLAMGEPNKKIAANLGIAEATVKAHVKTILRKLGVNNRTQVALWATSSGLCAGPLQLQLQV